MSFIKLQEIKIGNGSATLSEIIVNSDLIKSIKVANFDETYRQHVKIDQNAVVSEVLLDNKIYLINESPGNILKKIVPEKKSKTVLGD